MSALCTSIGPGGIEIDGRALTPATQLTSIGPGGIEIYPRSLSPGSNT